MSTNIYLVRHAESRYIPEDDDHSRPLTRKGKKDAKKLKDFFSDKNITKVKSSPYTRALNTVKWIAKDKNLDIELMDNLKERKVADHYLDDNEFIDFIQNQWNDFDFNLDGGESFNQVQKRGVKSLEKIVQKYNEENIIVGTHGTWLAVVLNYFDENYDYEFWKNLKMPDIFSLNYQQENLKDIKHLQI